MIFLLLSSFKFFIIRSLHRFCVITGVVVEADVGVAVGVDVGVAVGADVGVAFEVLL